MDVEGKSSGIEEDLVLMLGKWDELPITYAGGVATYHDIELINKLGNSKLDVTIGSSLDIFGGTWNTKSSGNVQIGGKYGGIYWFCNKFTIHLWIMFLMIIGLSICNNY